MFPTNTIDIQKKIDSIDAIKYCSTRNYTNGAVTRLSPYISRGVISTKQVLENVLNRGYDIQEIKKFIQELAWRDYFQMVWKYKGDCINQDMISSQQDIDNNMMPRAIIEANTGIKAIDNAISNFYLTGYLHNHIRMYIASIACNMGKSHWKVPAKWMYYHLLDADWASNALSWQWVSGSFSKKKYFANQQNINKFCNSNQTGTFLDVDYETFKDFSSPGVLQETAMPDLKTQLPEKKNLNIDPQLPTLIYNIYNMDPEWKKDIPANRILLLEPSVFQKYPVSGNTINFVVRLTENIDGMQIFTGEFMEMKRRYNLREIYFKEHPLNKHYRGKEESREWMFNVEGYFPSFFSFWKKCEKQI